MVQATNGGTEPLDDPATEVVVALMTIARRVKARVSDGREDTAAVMLLHHVLLHEPMRQSDLAVSVGLDQSTISRHVRTLEEAGHIARTGDPDDRRATRLETTERGRTLLEAATRARAALIRDVIADWPAADRRALTDLTQRLAAALDRPAGSKENA